MKNFLTRALVALFCFLPLAAHAQSTGTVVADCTTGVGLAYTPGSTRPMSLLPTGAACVSASVSASISGFTAASTGTPISVTTGGVTGTLPAGAVVVATNVGTTNAAYCALGASATTSSQYIAPAGGWFAFTVGASTQLTCITSTSTTTVNMTGGAGLPTGTGGGGGGGGGTVVQGNAGTNAQAWWTRIGDATSGPAKVQAGNAAAVADVALTVTDPNVLAAVNSGVGTPGSTSPSTDIAVGFNAVTAEPTKVTTGQNAAAYSDLVGKQIVSPYANREVMVRGAASTTGTGATTVIAASGSASLKTYVTDIECGRTDAGTTPITVTLNDVGGTGSGTVLIIPAGGGNNKSFHVPLVTAANTAFTFTASSGVTTLYCSAQGFTGY